MRVLGCRELWSMLRCPSTSETIISFLLLCLCLQLKFPTMTSSLFQTSRLKTVSKRPRCFSSVSLYVCACATVPVYVCFSLISTGVFVFRVSCGVCFSLSTLTFARTSAVWRAAAVLRVYRQVHGWVGVYLSICFCLPSVAHKPLPATEILLHCDLFA